MSTGRYRALYQVKDAYYAHVLQNYFHLSNTHPIGFHYTSGDSIVSILESEIFRLTNVRYMNDATELKHSVELLLDVVRPLENRILIRETAALEHLKEHVIPKLEERGSRQFVLSLSMDRDSSYLWKSYGYDDGCAFEFDIPGLINAFNAKNVLMRTGENFTYGRYSVFNGTLLYESVLQKRFVRDSVIFITRLLEAGHALKSRDDIQEISQCLTEMTYVLYAGLYNMKSEEHSQETEYRFVIVPDPEYSRVLTRERTGRKESYVEVKGILGSLKKVWIGPYCHNSNHIRNASNILVQKGGGPITIQHSECQP